MRIHHLFLALFLLILFTAYLGSSPLPLAPNCPIFPSSNVWNKDISRLPIHPNSRVWVNSIGPNDELHPDFGSNLTYGIPYNVVDGSIRKVPFRFDYARESDRGPYPIPPRPRIEVGSDHHLLIVDRDSCRLYELYDVRRVNGFWEAGSGAIWALRSNRLRPNGWTSADAAGLPILPGLVRYNEVAQGVINHALRFTAPRTRNAHIFPARHHAGESSNLSLPPMGLRVRVKRSFNISGFSVKNRVILTALKHYGMILADNGSPWFVTGVSDKRFNEQDLNELKRVKGHDFEVVDTRNLRNASE